MFDQIMDIVRQQGQQAVVANPAVPNEHNEDVMKEASSTVMNTMQEKYREGGPGALKTLFEGAQSGDPNHPEVQQMSNNFAGNITQKFGIPSGAAKALVVSLIPMVLSRFMNKAKDPNDQGLDIGGILGSLTGGGAGASGLPGGGGGGLMGSLGSLGSKFGLDKNGDGKTDLKDLMSMFGK